MFHVCLDIDASVVPMLLAFRLVLVDRSLSGLGNERLPTGAIISTPNTALARSCFSSPNIGCQCSTRACWAIHRLPQRSRLPPSAATSKLQHAPAQQSRPARGEPRATSGSAEPTAGLSDAAPDQNCLRRSRAGAELLRPLRRPLLLQVGSGAGAWWYYCCLDVPHLFYAGHTCRASRLGRERAPSSLVKTRSFARVCSGRRCR